MNTSVNGKTDIQSTKPYNISFHMFFNIPKNIYKYINEWDSFRGHIYIFRYI